MKRSNKILSMALALLMVIPMFAFAPLDVDAASAATHKTFSNVLDFEDATEGVLTADYVQSKLARGFSATSSASGIQYPELRTADNWTVAEEQKVTAQTAGADTTDTSDDTFTYEAAVTSSTANNGVDNKNYVLRQTTPGEFPMFTLWDDTGILFDQPFEYSFDIFPRGEQVDDAEGATTGFSTGLIHFCYNQTFKSGQRMNLVGMANGNPTYIAKGDGNFGTSFGSLKLNQWTSVRVRVYPSLGRVVVWVNGLQVNDSVLPGLTTLYNAGDHTSAGIAIGWNYGMIFDFDLDNISLCSVADTADISEHIDFTDARIDAVAATPETTTTQTLSEYLNANDATLTTGFSSGDYYLLKQDGDNWVMNQNIPQSMGSAAGLNFKDTTNLNNTDTVTVTFDFRKNVNTLANAYNTVRTSGGTTMGPLTFRGGQYITTHASGFATFRKTDTGYVQGTLVKDVWYSFKLELDLANTKMKLWMKEGTADGPSTGDWEPVYYILNGTADCVSVADEITAAGSNASNKAAELCLQAPAAASNTYPLEEYAEKMVTEADLKWWNGSGAYFSSSPQLWLLHGTGNAWSSQNDADMDNLSIVTADGGVDVSFDFTPEIVTVPGTPEIPANTDWWVNDTFVNADAKKGGSKLTDFQVVDATEELTYTYYDSTEKADKTGTGIIDPSGKYGKVIRPKANLGSFCFNDTKNLLPSYVFDVSFDFYMTKAPSSNIHLLKLWAPYTATDSGANATVSTVVLQGNYLYTYDEVYAKNDKRFPLNYQISNNTWYNFRVRFDLLKGQYMLYVNGRLLHVQDVSAAYTAGIDLNDLERLHFAIHNHWGSSVKGYHFLDNIRVETVDEAKRASEEFADYEILNADFEDAAWLTSAEAGEIPYFSMDYSKASILSDAGIAGNSALCLTGTVGGAMSVDMLGMGGYHSTFSVEMSVSYGNFHGSALDLAILVDQNLSENKTLLSVMGDNSNSDLTGALFFNDDGNRYYLCDYTGKLYHSDNGDAEAASFTDVALIVDVTSDSYAIYINQKPAYYKAYGAADTLTRANSIPLGLDSDKTELKNPMLSLISCSSDSGTVNKVLVDDVRVASVKNGLTPVLVGYQENVASGTAIRFLATVDTLYYEEMGFIVEAKDVTNTFSTTTVFTSVTANGSEVVAKDLDGRYITALVVSDINESPVEFTVTPYAVFFGKEIRGESQVITYTE